MSDTHEDLKLKAIRDINLSLQYEEDENSEESVR